MSIGSPADLAALKRVGRVVRETIEELQRNVRPGVSTLELDHVAAKVFDAHGARSAPHDSYGFPGTVLISVNDEVVHGVPGPRRLAAGDLVKLDVTAELDGYVADAAVTVVVGRASGLRKRLKDCAEAALEQALGVARAGTPLRDIGRVIEAEVRRRGFSVIPELCGHGVGRAIHEWPHNILNFDDPSADEVLSEGLVITIEPIIAVGSGRRFVRAYTAGDGWTVKTADGSLAAHVEHSLVVTRDRPVVLTA